MATKSDVEAIDKLLGLVRKKDESYNDAFERIAEMFRKDTGYLRPGKDCRNHDPEVREAAYAEWVNKVLEEGAAAWDRVKVG